MDDHQSIANDSHPGQEVGLKAEAGCWEKLDELPFDFVRRRLSVVLQVGVVWLRFSGQAGRRQHDK